MRCLGRLCGDVDAIQRWFMFMYDLLRDFYSYSACGRPDPSTAFNWSESDSACGHSACGKPDSSAACDRSCYSTAYGWLK
jgi:hypothetical protein